MASNKQEAMDALESLRKIATYNTTDEGSRIALYKIERAIADYINWNDAKERFTCDTEVKACNTSLAGALRKILMFDESKGGLMQEIAKQALSFWGL